MKPADFQFLEKFLLILGNARSGSTLLGALLDAHPEAVVGHETLASQEFWRNRDRRSILEEIGANSERHREAGKEWEGYRYGIRGFGRTGMIRVAGDKIWNPATLLLHGDHGLWPRMEETMGVPLRALHVLRDPFDVVATMSVRSRAPLADRIRWYFMHCDAVAALSDRLEEPAFRTVRLEELIARPGEGLASLCGWLGLEPGRDYVDACRERIFARPKRTRADVAWDTGDVRAIVRRAGDHSFLRPYLREWGDDPLAIGEST
ncbi:MAG: hypothetical protein ACLFRP_00430 [Puniceicoccaceae bacterium]